MYGTIQKGFTLIELMVVVAIIGILSAWGIPQYADYAISSKFSEAHGALSIGQTAMEQYYQDNRTYVSGTGMANACGMNLAPLQTQNFTITCTATATTFTATATGTTGKGVDGFAFTIDQLNAKTTTLSGSAIAGGDTACWAKKRNGKC